MAAYILSNALFYIKDILPITSGAGATFRISKDLERDLNIETGGVNAFVLLKNSAQIERMLVTCTGGVATIVKRGLEQDGITENANLKKVWGDGSIGYISVKPDDFIALGKLDTAGGLRNTMLPSQNIGATNGSTAITVTDTTGWANGATITGTGIPNGTTIVSFVANTSAVLSANFTGTTGTVSVQVGIRYDTEIENTGVEMRRARSAISSIINTNLLTGIDPSTRARREFPISLLQSSLSGITSEYPFAGSASVNDSCYYSEIKKFYTGFADIGKTTAITDILFYSTGVTEQKYTFYFKKVLSPQDLTVRIETDNGSGARSGTLVDASAVLATAIASIPADGIYEISFPASFINAPLGTPVHFVFWQGSQAVNATNYIQVGIEAETAVVYDRLTSPGSSVNSTRAVTSGSNNSGVYTSITTFIAVNPVQIVSFGYLVLPTGVTSFNITGPGVNSTYTTLITTPPEPIVLVPGGTYTITIIGNGNYYNVTGWGALGGSGNITWNTSGALAMDTITTRTITATENAGLLRKYISKALATTSLKANVYAMLPQSVTAGSYPSIIKDRYLGGFSGLIKGTTYYLSNTGVLSSTAGTVSKVLGVAINSTTIRIDSAINAS